MTDRIQLGELVIEGQEATNVIKLLRGEIDKVPAALFAVNQANDKAVQAFEKGGFGKLAGDVKDVREAVQAAGNELATSGFKALALAGAFGKVVSVVGDVVAGMLRASAAAEANDRAVAALGGRYDDLRRATNGAVDAQSAFQVNEGLLRSHFALHADDLETVNRAAREFSLLHGGDMTEAAQRLQQAIEQGDNVALAQYGVQVEQGAAGTERFRQAMEQLTDAQHRAAPPAQTQAESLARMNREWEEFKGQAASLASGPLRVQVQMFNALAGGINDAVRSLRGLGSGHDEAHAASERRHQEQLRSEALEREAEQRAKDYNRALVEMSRQNAEAARTANLLSGALQQIARDAEAGTAGIEHSIANAVSLGRTRIEELRRQSLASREVMRQLRRGGATQQEIGAAGITDPLARSGGGGSGLGGLRSDLDAARAASIAMGAGTIDETGRVRGESESARLRALIDAYRELTEGQREYYDQQRAYAATLRENEAANQRFSDGLLTGGTSARQFSDDMQSMSDRLGEILRQNNEQLKRFNFGAQLAEQFGLATDEMGRATHQTQQLAEQMSGSIRGAFDSMTGAFKSHLAAVITGKEDLGTALKGIVHETLLNLATESAVKAIFNTAQGFALLASYQYPQAAAAFTSAGLYGAVAVAAGAGAAITAPTQSQTPAGAGSQSTGRTPSASNGSAGAGGSATHTTVINVNGALETREGIQDAVVRAQDIAARRGAVPRELRRAAQRRAA